ncbi:MAG: alanine dehydrogenase [Bacteroidia bacterium]
MTTDPLAGFSSKYSPTTLEAPIRISRKSTSLTVGVPRERGYQENRVALTPLAVGQLVALGHEVLVESKAGLASFFSDQQYSEAGARIIYDLEELYKAHIIVKVGPVPADEVKYLSPGKVVLSAIHLPTINEAYLKAFLDKRVIGIAYEYLRDKSDSLPIVRSMSEIAGSSAILIAAEYMSNQFQGTGKLLGGVSGIPPSKVVILGAGTVGEFAARTALGLGSDVRLFDNSISRLKRIQNNLGQRVYTSVIQPEILAEELRTADVAVGAMHADKGRAPMVVSEAMVQSMKAGAVIVDVSIDQGGCFETSEVTNHTKPVFIKHEVIHYCVPNIPSRVSQTASVSLSNILGNLLIDAGEQGGVETYLWLEKGLRAGIYCYNGNLTNRYLSEKFGINFTNLELIAAARM